jgi:hypothetical protein
MKAACGLILLDTNYPRLREQDHRPAPICFTVQALSDVVWGGRSKSLGTALQRPRLRHTHSFAAKVFFGKKG